MNKSRILIWLVVLLSVLNLSIITVVVYHHIQEQKALSGITIDAEGQSCLNGRFFRQHLGFDDDQMVVFRKTNQEFQPKAQGVILQLDLLRTEAFDLLNQENSDSLRLKEISSQIGVLHEALKNATNTYYLGLKSVCTPQQEVLLKEVFTPLFRDASFNSSNNPTQGQQRQNNIKPQ